MGRQVTNRGNAMSDEQTRGERLQIMLSPDELKVLDDFRFKVRMPSRAAAVRELLKRGLAAEGYAVGRIRQQINRLWRDRQARGWTRSLRLRRQTERADRAVKNAPGNTPPSISRFCPVM